MQQSRPDLLTSIGTRMNVAARRMRAVLDHRLGRTAFDPLPPPVLVGEVESFTCRPALFEPDQLSRVLGCGFGADLNGEITRLQATSFTGMPAERYDLGESILIGGTVIAGRSRYIFQKMSKIKSMLSQLAVYDRATLLNSEQGMSYFGHWLRDDCSHYEAVKDAPALLSMALPDWPDRKFYQHAFGQNWNVTKFARVGELTVWRDLNYNSAKANHMRSLRGRLRRAVPTQAGGKIVYLGRGNLGEKRNMSNAVSFEAAMRKAGVDVIEPGNGIEGMLDAKVIITIEGSQASHSIYNLADGGSLLILQPPERFYNPMRHWASLLGMTYGIVIGKKDATSFHIDPDEVFRMLDRLLALSAGLV
nr:glycosyltransferase 61 family protein [Tabrizicola sp.]